MSQCFPEILISLLCVTNKEPSQVPDGGMPHVWTCPNWHGVEGRAQEQMNGISPALQVSCFCTMELLTLTNTND